MSKVKIETVLKVKTRARIWCFTINNPDEKDESHLSHEKFLNGIKYMVWQLEEGENKTPHIQGVVQLKNQVSFETMKLRIPGAHLEVCKNFNASKHYCQKVDGRIDGPYFYPKKGEKMSEQNICQWISDYLEFGDLQIEDDIPEDSFVMPDGWVAPP